MINLNFKSNKIKIREVTDKKDLESLYNFRIKNESLSDKIFSSKHTLESFYDIFKTGKIWSIYEGENLVGYTRIQIGASDLGDGFDDLNIENSITLKGTFIQPDCRGRGLQRLLHLKSQKHIKNRKYRTIMSFVHPKNIASLKNLKKLGLVIYGIKQGTNGTPRLIMHKTINNK